MIEVEIERANIKLEMSSSNDVETEYYGTGSDKILSFLPPKIFKFFSIISEITLNI